MTSEEIKAIVYYIQGLQALWKEGYNAEKVALYNYQFSLRAEMDMPDGLLDVIEMLEMWDDNWIYGAAPLTEKEAAAIIQEELLTYHIRIPADTLAIIDVVEDPHIQRLQASLWGI